MNPDWTEPFFVNYHFERNQILKVEIYDEDDESGGDVDDLIGNFECYLNKLLTAHNQTIKGDLVMGVKAAGNRGKIFLTANSVSKSNNIAKMTILCKILDIKNNAKKGFLCFCKPPKDNPFLVIEKTGQPSTEWLRVHETETQHGVLEPEFKKINIHLFRLCNSNRTAPLRFSLYSKQEGTDKPILYGSLEITAKELEMNPTKERELLNDNAKVKVAGTIVFSNFDIVD